MVMDPLEIQLQMETYSKMANVAGYLYFLTVGAVMTPGVHAPEMEEGL